jgi:hypothetical protein
MTLIVLLKGWKSLAVSASTRAEEKFAQIQNWPHWHEIGLVAQKEYSVSPEEFQVLLPEYQRFMTLIALGYKHMGMHSDVVDQVWHSHILYSKFYRQFCASCIGRWVDHLPNLTSAVKQCEAPPTPPPEPPQPLPDTPPVQCFEACEYDDDPRDCNEADISFTQAYLETFHMSPPLSLWGI